MVTGLAPDPGEGLVTAVISYEDESGNETQLEKEFSLYVYEESYDDIGKDIYYEDFETDGEEQASGAPVAAIVLCAAAAVMAVIVIIAIAKKRKKAKQLREELDMLDDDDGDDLS